ncbi:hypothetical protein RRG08_005615 [Elysia crispata]|uniref:Uncharacterized protein n=1 Tax=Elysia crispata TaxID=231223 RepID=A0AAE0YX99_9GAST|nr:hypothetical protein RRG08_005615 [Elysia crispata]
MLSLSGGVRRKPHPQSLLVYGVMDHGK